MDLFIGECLRNDLVDIEISAEISRELAVDPVLTVLHKKRRFLPQF
jgi:hypothetical protein